MNRNHLFRLFVYGTLKRGYWNHEVYCKSAVSVEEAAVRGRLYELPSGIPVLLVPEGDVLAVGTTDPLADMATQLHFVAGLTNPEPSADGLLQNASSAPWVTVCGELLTFDDPEARLPAIDRLEGLCPAGTSLYQRVLVPVRLSDGGVTTAWCYISSSQTLQSARATDKTMWP
jgi:gamma-glutamylcyclotransferase (GGCT)/AIG2-like uncharacterized protein YtfP